MKKLEVDEFLVQIYMRKKPWKLQNRNEE